MKRAFQTHHIIVWGIRTTNIKTQIKDIKSWVIKLLWLKLKCHRCVYIYIYIYADFVVRFVDLGGYKIIQTCYLCPCLTLNFILIFTLFNRLPQRLGGFLLSFFLLNLFFFSQFFAAISKLCLRSLFLFMLYFLFSTFFPSLWSWRSVWLVFTATLHGVFVTLCVAGFHNWMLLHFLKQ